MRAEVEKEIQRILPLIPKRPPEDTIDILKKRGFLKDERLLYKIAYGKQTLHDGTIISSGKSVFVKCSCCSGETFLEYAGNDDACHKSYVTYGFIEPLSRSAIASGDCCVCPMCGTGMRALRSASFKSSTEIDSKMYMSVHNIDGYLVLLSWVTKKLLHDDGTVSYFNHGYEGIVVILGTMVRVKQYYQFMSSISWCADWAYTKRCDDRFGAFSKDEILKISRSTVEQSNCSFSALSEYLMGGGKLAPERYIKLWLKHPNVENLVRQGYSKLVSEIIDKATSYTGFKISDTSHYINWSKVKPTDMLDLSKDELCLAKEISIDGLEFYRLVKKEKGLRLSSEFLKSAQKYGYYSIKMLTLFPTKYDHRIPLVHLINYLEKQRSNLFLKGLISIQYLKDYWDAIYRVYESVPDELIWPKNLNTAHDDAITRVKEKESEELNAKIKSRLSDLNQFCYRNEALGLMIRPAASHSELIAEGKALHHCVGGYAKSHADGSTSIFFIRKISSEDIPFYTLEYKNGKVQQNRGDRNCSRTQEVEDFEKEWLEHIKNKEFIKNGKRSSRNQNKQQAIA